LCGIVGIFAPKISESDLTQGLLKMRAKVAHRGPDDNGMFVSDGIALGHCRLSIIDPEDGHQPLSNEDGTIQLIINGEIYNYAVLRQMLKSQGHELRTKSDSEVLVHLYEEKGKDCLNYIDGMFAFALWDANRKTLMLARDRFGIKPLYFAKTKEGILFASELTAIAYSGFVQKQIDPQAVYAYLAFSYVPAPIGIFKNIEKIRPAERIVCCKDKNEKDIYWRPKAANTPRRKSEAVEELDSLLEVSVKSHLVADVPVAAFLSGGVDSSTVVAMARRSENIETFCVSFPGTDFDEGPIARRVSRHLSTYHHQVEISVEPKQLIREVVSFMDEPFADSSALPTFAVCRAARKIAKVMLSGDGGDEIFGGYTGRYRIAALKAAVPYPDVLSRLLKQIPPWRNGKRSSMPRMLALAALPENECYLADRQITTPEQRSMLLDEKAFSLYEPILRDFPEQAMRGVDFHHQIHRALWQDIRTSLVDDMLTKVDRMSMAHGLEVRVPMLDHRLVEFAFSLPPHWLVSAFPVEGKRLLRKVAVPLLPPGVLNRPKQGFVVPLNHWIRECLLELFDDVCLSTDNRLSDWMDRNAIFKLRNEPIANQPRQDLYALLVLELWLRRMGM
jgi:asparagine synthase (glutamine-hydrolysing)